jgi:hypothetical protein
VSNLGPGRQWLGLFVASNLQSKVDSIKGGTLPLVREESSLAIGWYRTIRLVLWAMAMIAASVPAILEWLEGASFNNTLFRDILFVIIPAAALGLSTVLDYLCMNYHIKY